MNSSWQVLPVLGVQKLNGSLILSPSGMTQLSAEAAVNEGMIVPSLLEWRAVRVDLDVEPFNASDFSFPEMVVRARGGLLVGGDDRFYAKIEGTIDTRERSATLAIEHPGGWSPLPALSDYFSTPRFSGTAAFNVNGTYIAVSAQAVFVEPIGIAGILEIAAHPYIASRTGAAFTIDLVRQTNESASDWRITFDAGVRVGGEGGATLGCKGEFEKGGPARLLLESREGYRPIPMLPLPMINGSLAAVTNPWPSLSMIVVCLPHCVACLLAALPSSGMAVRGLACKLDCSLLRCLCHLP